MEGLLSSGPTLSSFNWFTLTPLWQIEIPNIHIYALEIFLSLRITTLTIKVNVFMYATSIFFNVVNNKSKEIMITRRKVAAAVLQTALIMNK